MFLRSADEAVVAAESYDGKENWKEAEEVILSCVCIWSKYECKEQHSNHSQSTTIGSPFEWTTLHNNYDLEAQK